MPEIVVCAGNRSTKEALKSQFIECLASTDSNTTTLRQVVRSLIAQGIHWKEILGWADEAGYRDKAIRKLLSLLLLEAGVRRRKAGAGPRTPPESQPLAAYAQNLYPRNTLRILQGACRIIKAQQAGAETGRQEAA